MTAATRTTPGRLALLAAETRPRDWAVLGSVARLRLVCTRQLERLHFTGSTPLANARSCRRHLARLRDQGLLVRLDRRIGGVRAGSAGYLWSLGAAGQHLLTRRGPAGGRQVRRPWTPSAPFVAHRLAVSELYVCLVEAQRAGGGELIRYQAEPDCWRCFTGSGGQAATLKPDAHVVTASGDYEHAWFIEVDLATESPAVLRRKCRTYLTYWRSGREQARTGLFPLVVFVVPDAAWASVVGAVWKPLASSDQALFRVTTSQTAAGQLLRGQL